MANIQTPSAPKLCLIVPAFNEEAVLLDSLQVLESKLTQMIQAGIVSSQSVLLLVDDGSRDGTWGIARTHFLSKNLLRDGRDLAQKSGDFAQEGDDLARRDLARRDSMQEDSDPASPPPP